MMNYFINQKTTTVYAYDDGQLSQIKRLTEIEELIKEKETAIIDINEKIKISETEIENNKMTPKKTTQKKPQDKGNEKNTQSEKALFEDEKNNIIKLLSDISEINKELSLLKDEYKETGGELLPVIDEFKNLKKMSKNEVEKHIKKQENNDISI